MIRSHIRADMRPVVYELVVALALSAACSVGPSLPTSPKLPEGAQVMCEMALLEGVLHGDPGDSRVAWLAPPTGVRRELQWPWGFTARFTPKLELVAEGGAIVAREWDDVDLGGGIAPDSDVFAVCEINGTLYLPD